MPRLNVTTRDGLQRQVEGNGGASLMETIRNAGVEELAAICGGSMACATCHVYVDEPYLAKLPVMSSSESELLDTCERRTSRSRLSCQIILSAELDGLGLTIAPE
jgi:ferredoxin, 2Fe-2S